MAHFSQKNEEALATKPHSGGGAQPLSEKPSIVEFLKIGGLNNHFYNFRMALYKQVINHAFWWIVGIFIYTLMLCVKQFHESLKSEEDSTHV